MILYYYFFIFITVLSYIFTYDLFYYLWSTFMERILYSLLTKQLFFIYLITTI